MKETLHLGSSNLYRIYKSAAMQYQFRVLLLLAHPFAQVLQGQGIRQRVAVKV